MSFSLQAAISPEIPMTEIDQEEGASCAVITQRRCGLNDAATLRVYNESRSIPIVLKDRVAQQC